MTSTVMYQSGLYGSVAGLEFSQRLLIPGLIFTANQALLTTRPVSVKHRSGSVMLWGCFSK